MDYNSSPTGEGVMWDLRQFYVDWIRQYTIDFTLAQRVRNYPEMFEKLQDWHSAVWGRVIKKFDAVGKEDKDFKEIINKLIKKSNEHQYTWSRRRNDPKAVSELNNLFREAVSYIVYLQKSNKLFGSENTNRSL